MRLDGPMCGIAGFYRLDSPAAPSEIRNMCRAIVHRGPDDEGIHVDGGCAIGMRRLSIIDLSTGHQPISNEDGTIWVVFNGEIYNYHELRDFLVSRGHRFATSSDTETLVHLYEEEGPAGAARLRGMFSYAIWDSRNRTLCLARDRFGKKPLYYAALPNGLFFASELKSFRELALPLDLDRDALRLYFQFGYLAEPETPYRQVRKLQPGSWLTFDCAGRQKTGQYWRLPIPAETAPPDLTYDEARGRLRELFDESVRIRLMSDVPLGAFLSGGIDSSSVVASMAQVSDEPVRTFSIGFKEAEFNELDYARMVAERYRTEHHEIVVEPDCVNLVPRLVDHFDEPFADTSAIPTFIVSEFASRYVKVVLTGDGGDELFAGYDRFFAMDWLARMDTVPPALLRTAGWLTDRLPYSAYGKNFLQLVTRPTPIERYMQYSFAPHYLRERLLQPEWMFPVDTAFLQRRFAPSILLDQDSQISPLTRAMYFESVENLTGDMLVKVDRMSMAHSIEARSPLLDHKLAEFAALLPHEWKMRNGQGKSIFLDAVRDRLPEGILNRPKKGFGVPLASWFRGPLRDFARDHVMSASFLNRGFVSATFLEEILTEHESGRRNNSYWIWALLVLELWFRRSNLAASN